MEPLSVLLGSATRARLLEFLFEHPTESFGIRESALRAGGLDYRTTRRELSRLTEMGFVRTVGSGRTRKYALDRDHPAHLDLRGLVLKLGGHGAVRMLRDELAGQDWIRAAALFGSLAAGSERAESDVDLLVVGEGSEEEFLPIAERLQVQLGRPLEFLLYTPQELADQLGRPDSFLRQLLEEQLTVLKGADVLAH